jgi:hypothetical protein
MCDLLAGDPFDPHKRAPGLPFGDIDAEKAVPAWRAAVNAELEEGRYCYQLGRALFRADKRDDAVPLLRAAAAKGYPEIHTKTTTKSATLTSPKTAPRPCSCIGGQRTAGMPRFF